MAAFRYYFLLFISLASLPLAGQNEAVLLVHTPLQLVTMEETIAADVQPGDLVTMRVLLDVKVKGEIVIRNGAFAQAQVRLRDKNDRRKKPELLLVPSVVQAVNSKLLPLHGEGLHFGGRGRRNRPALPTGKIMAAAIRYSTKIFL